MGGATITATEAKYPGTFDALVVYEPIIYPPPSTIIKTVEKLVETKHPEIFSSISEYSKCKKIKNVTETWDPRVTIHFCNTSVYYDEKSKKFILKCPMRWEVTTYKTSMNYGVWDWVPKVKIPVYHLEGSKTTIREKFRSDLNKLFTKSIYRVIDSGHFWPMEEPEIFSSEILKFVKEVSKEL
eukprot:TRINITY_DN1347_c0_g2_i1.p1 TRINITY_DN1347_c0_g2~~TRINITY_DN1347_c0_g2_i1.p1  ORF type:complete len:183 (+),score=26.55 TRINITY_DN1347_c0_g2_i1:237-785(+)